MKISDKITRRKADAGLDMVNRMTRSINNINDMAAILQSDMQKTWRLGRGARQSLPMRLQVVRRLAPSRQNLHRLKTDT